MKNHSVSIIAILLTCANVILLVYPRINSSDLQSFLSIGTVIAQLWLQVRIYKWFDERYSSSNP